MILCQLMPELNLTDADIQFEAYMRSAVVHIRDYLKNFQNCNDQESDGRRCSN